MRKRRKKSHASSSRPPPFTVFEAQRNTRVHGRLTTRPRAATKCLLPAGKQDRPSGFKVVVLLTWREHGRKCCGRHCGRHGQQGTGGARRHGEQALIAHDSRGARHIRLHGALRESVAVMYVQKPQLRQRAQVNQCHVRELHTVVKLQPREPGTLGHGREAARRQARERFEIERAQLSEIADARR